MAGRDKLLAQIEHELQTLNLPVQRGGYSDLDITTEFLNASWLGGNKKIHFEGLVRADASDQTIYYYSMTKETGSGFSFGSSSSESFQSGTTVYRNVKLVQYGLDGKAYEVKLDLGAIPKQVKAVATAQGWRFKTVILRGKMATTGSSCNISHPRQSDDPGSPGRPGN